MNIYDETYKRARDTVTAIAEHLEGWEMESKHDDRWPHLKHQESGAGVYIRVENYGSQSGRMVASCLWPENDGRYMGARDWGVIPHDTDPPSCSFSPDRKPETIAKELDRKVLTEYLPLYFKALEKQADYQKRRDTAESNQAKFASIVGVRLTDYELKRDDRRFSGIVESIDTRIEVEFHGDKTTIKMHYLPADAAEQVLTALMQIGK